MASKRRRVVKHETAASIFKPTKFKVNFLAAFFLVIFIAYVIDGLCTAHYDISSEFKIHRPAFCNHLGNVPNVLGLVTLLLFFPGAFLSGLLLLFYRDAYPPKLLVYLFSFLSFFVVNYFFVSIVTWLVNRRRNRRTWILVVVNFVALLLIHALLFVAPLLVYLL